MHKTEHFWTDSPVGQLKLSLAGGKLYSVELLREQPPLPENALSELSQRAGDPPRFGPLRGAPPRFGPAGLPHGRRRPPAAGNKGKSLFQTAREGPPVKSLLFAESPPSFVKAFFAAPGAKRKRRRTERRQGTARRQPAHQQAAGRIPGNFSCNKALRKDRRFLENLSLFDRGTVFQKAVWREVQKIPWGKTGTYQEIACKIGRPKAARAVGQACAANPFLIAVPCHRVTASGGRLGGFALGLKAKRLLLAAER